MISSSRPDLPAFMAYLERVERARKLVAEFDEWLASAPPLPSVEAPAELTDGRSQINWETTEDLAVRVVGILRIDGGPLRARAILEILQETGTSFISDNPVYSVKKGRGSWQAASQVPAEPCAVGGGESVARIEQGDGQGIDE